MDSFVLRAFWWNWLFMLLPCQTVSFESRRCPTKVNSFIPRERNPFHHFATTHATRRTHKLPERTIRSASSSAYSESSESSSPKSQSQQYSSSVYSNKVENSQQAVRSDERPTLRMELPWSDFQEWALFDHLPRYTVSIPGMQVPVALWRTMSREVTELNGYPVEFLRSMHARGIDSGDDNNNARPASDVYQRELQQENQPSESLLSSPSASRTGNAVATTTISTPYVLPFLDEFEFQPSGGLCGRVYGLSGIADGTRITTTPVHNVQVTLPKGFVQTVNDEGDCGTACIAYELGKPLVTDGTPNSSPYSLDGANMAGDLARALFTNANNAVSTANLPNGQVLLDSNNNNVLVQIGGLTTLVLGGALAVNLLSHHLTINVFWV